MSKRTTSIIVEDEYLKALKSLGVNISALCNDALEKAVMSLDGNAQHTELTAQIAAARDRIAEKQAREEERRKSAAMTDEERVAHIDKLMVEYDKEKEAK